MVKNKDKPRQIRLFLDSAEHTLILVAVRVRMVAASRSVRLRAPFQVSDVRQEAFFATVNPNFLLVNH